MKRRIFVIATDGAACLHYRLRLPLLNLNPEEFEVIWEPPDDKWHPGDLVIGQRIAGDNQAWLDMCEAPGLTTVYDLDDNLLRVDRANSVPFSIYDPIVPGTYANIAASTVVTVSTPKLAEAIKAINPNTFVLPNCLPNDYIAAIQFPQDQITVGWCGSMFHIQDWGGVAQQLAIYAQQEPRARFSTIGADYMNPVVPARVHPWTTVEGAWHAMDFNIGIAPLVRTTFNEHKSWIKVLEYAARGVPAVAPRIGQYPEFIEHGRNGYLYDVLEEIPPLLLQLSDDGLRSQMGEAAMNTALQYTIDKQIGRWETIYREVYK
jgi:Glycosyl transferases group 1